jgi:phage I-like protein
MSEAITMRADPRKITTLDEAVDMTALGIDILGPKCWADGTLKCGVWIEVLQCGEYLGHSSGPLTVTRETLDQIVQNFSQARDSLPLIWNFEHAASADPTEGNIAVSGVPAQGWGYALKRIDASLYCLTVWNDLARDGIKNGEFAFCSPGFSLSARDGKTGAQIGARLHELSIVGAPFLSTLEGLKAASDRTPVDVAIALRDAQASVLTLTAKLREADDRRTASDALAVELSDRARAADDKVRSLEKEIATFRADEETRIVTARHMTYKDKNALAPPSMLTLFRADRAAFDREYPELDPSHAYLLRDITPPPTRDAPDQQGNPVKLLAAKIAREQGIDPSEAYMLADAQMRP